MTKFLHLLLKIHMNVFEIFVIFDEPPFAIRQAMRK